MIGEEQLCTKLNAPHDTIFLFQELLLRKVSKQRISKEFKRMLQLPASRRRRALKLMSETKVVENLFDKLLSLQQWDVGTLRVSALDSIVASVVATSNSETEQKAR